MRVLKEKEQRQSDLRVAWRFLGFCQLAWKREMKKHITARKSKQLGEYKESKM